MGILSPGAVTFRRAGNVSDYIVLTATAGFEDGTMKLVEAQGHEFLVARVGDDYYVSDARCPHLHAHLTKGTLEGTVVTCPLHHSQFDLVDGHVVRWTDFTGAVKTVAEFARHSRPLRVYEVAVEGENLSVGPQKTPPVAE